MSPQKKKIFFEVLGCQKCKQKNFEKKGTLRNRLTSLLANFFTFLLNGNVKKRKFEKVIITINNFFLTKMFNNTVPGRCLGI